MLSDLVFPVWLLVLGALGGSAMAACADRLETGQSWLRDRSACAACGTRLRPGDLVPVISYLRLRGRCRQCRTALPKRLLLAEVLGIGCAALALVLATGAGPQIAGTLFLLLLLGLFLCDLQTMRLPDVLTAPLAIAGLWVGVPWHGLAMGLLAALLGVAVFYALSKTYEALRGYPGLGLGDVKMMAGLSAMAGPLGIPWVTLLAAAAALGVAAMRRKPVTATTAFPLGCYLAVAGAVVWALKSLGLI